MRTLTVMRDTADMVRENYELSINFDQIPFDDSNVYKMLSNGETAGVFQLESPGMTGFIKEMKPSNLEDIIAGISLYRPGPMEQIPKYVRCLHNPETISYDHPLLIPILNMTYGCIVYQEQVMQIVRELAGFSMGQADNVRRAMSKKNRKKWQNIRICLFMAELTKTVRRLKVQLSMVYQKKLPIRFLRKCKPSPGMLSTNLMLRVMRF